MQINLTTERSALLEKLMRLTAARPDKLSVRETEMSEKVIFTVKCDDRDYGRIVGKMGANVKEWSVLADSLCQYSLQKPAETVVNEPATRIVHPPDKYENNPSWGEAQLKPLVMEVCNALFQRGAVEVKELGTILAVSVTVMDDKMLMDEFKISQALSRVFRCVGAAQGRRVECEVVYHPISDSKDELWPRPRPIKR